MKGSNGTSSVTTKPIELDELPTTSHNQSSETSSNGPSLRHRLKQWTQQWHQTYIEELLLRRKPLPPSKDGRHVPLRPGHDEPLVDERRGHAYVSNSIRSARYTVWDFLPRQFLFQATRLHNFYFICIGVPQTIPGLSTTGNFTTILPLMFFMLLTIVKEGYDDWRRHRLDNVENNSLATVLTARHYVTAGARSRKPWSATLSDITSSLVRSLPWIKGRPTPNRLKEEEPETDLDAEFQWSQIKWHNIEVGHVLRLRRNDAVPADVVILSASGEDGLAYIETMALDGETSLKSRQAPHALQHCDCIAGVKTCGAVFVLEDPNKDLFDFNGRVQVGGTTYPLTLNEIVYRGSVLRNTDTVIGVVINTGEECKIRMNANHHPKAKKPRLEQYANQIVLTLIFYVVILSVGVSMGYLMWHRNTETRSWYLNNAYVGFEEIIVGYLIMFNNVIPLALYVSLEIVKVGQQLLVTNDMEMYDEASDTRMGCNTNTILENLGQIGFVLSDKTGTLTQNVMKFRKISVAGLAWAHDEPDVDATVLSTSNADALGKGGESHSAITSVARQSMLEPPRPSFSQRKSIDRDVEPQRTTSHLLEHMRRSPTSDLARKARDFILAVALCHTALPETGKDGNIDFQVASPDELALVRAAQDFGFLVIQRSTQRITLLVTGSGGESKECYDILEVIEFNSSRKRMSIIVRCPDGRIRLICKGADSVLVPRLTQAELATRKSKEVRRSVEAERELTRRSMQIERLSGVGSARPSMAIERVRRSMEVSRSLDLRPSIDRSRLDVALRPSFDATRTRHNQRSSSLRPPGEGDDAALFSRTFKHLDEFATEGLRTLLFAHRYISESEYNAWKKIWGDASTALTDRQGKIETAGDIIEQSLDLLGASAIEDKLQAGVPETVDKLRRANMRIWMLTGDKRETAINIAHSARICRPESEMFILNASKGDVTQQMRATSDALEHGCLHSVLVIDGHTLADIENVSTQRQAFYSLIASVDSVICCRASPAQKANIVKSIPAHLPNALTLAIGDGANDVAMIQAAHVGVGISGKEGLQAARVADYSIAQFRFLQRLLLVHGHWNYDRTAKFILWTFWKEMFFYMMQALYQRCDGYTGTSLYEMWSLTVLNTLFTSLCTIIPGIFEQDLSAETLLAVPELYVYGQRNMGLNLPRYFAWVIGATAEGIIVWFISWAAFGYLNVMGDNGLFALGDLCFSLGIMWTNWKLLLTETHHKSRIVICAFLITTGGWWAWNGFMAHAYSSNLSPYDVKGGFSNNFGRDFNWWLAVILALAVLAILELSCKLVRRLYNFSGTKTNVWRGIRKHSSDKTARLEVRRWQELERDPVVRDILRNAAESGPALGTEEVEFDEDSAIDNLATTEREIDGLDNRAGTPAAATNHVKARPRVYERMTTG